MLSHGDEDDEQRTLLADFGIARDIDDISGLTTTNMAVGTVAYSAPAQPMGEEIDGRADQYALAATTYHLLTGAQLFPHSNPAVVISRHPNSPPPALADSRPELAALDPVLATALAKDPEGRFPRCSDFARAFAEDAATRGRAASAAPTTPAQTARKSAAAGAAASIKGPSWRAVGGGSRGRMITVAASLAAVLLIGVVALGWHALHQRQPPAAKTPSSTAAGPLSPSAAPPAARSTTLVACGVNNDADQVYAAMDTFVRANPTFAFSGAVDKLPGNGNFDPCATLSTVVIVPRVGTIESYRQALMFHRGQYIGPATVVPYGFISFNATATTDNQVVLNFRATEGSCGACNDAVEVPVRFRWMDGRMAMLDTPPNLYRQ
jgi:serine/threonine-protein kinase